MIDILTFNYNEKFKHAHIHTQKVKTVQETLRKALKYTKCLF